jgi:hypothetical protein
MTTKAKFVLLIPSLAMIVGPPAARAADPTTGECLTATESSLNLRNAHKLRDARSKLLICSASSCPADIRTECVRRMAEVNAAIPGIVFDAKDAAGNDLVAVTVTMDGHTLTERLEGTAISIDPGPHKFAFATTGQPRVEKQFVIREGEKNRRERILFGPTTASVALGVSVATLAPPAAAPGAALTVPQRSPAIVPVAPPPGTAAAPPTLLSEPAPAAEEKESVTAKPWFWATVGGVVVAAVVVGVVLASAGGAKDPSPSIGKASGF